MIAKKAWDRIQLNEFYEYKLNSIITVLSGQIEEICQKYKYQDQFSLESEICDKIFIEKYFSEKLKKFAILKDFYPMEDDYKINIFSQNTAICP